MSGPLLLKERNASDAGLNKFRSVLSLSEDWNQEYWMQWHAENWMICFPFAMLYMLAVYYGFQHMKDRKPYNLRYLLGLWSAALGVFSMIGSYYFLPEILTKLYRDGFHAAACDNTYKSDKTYMFWAWMFTWSKVFEFGDTIFIVLRKQKLTFLHWFHHAMTVVCVFAYFPGNNSINRWTGAMNYFIHSIMYTYYSFKAFRIFVPRFISFVITVSQIAQMFIGFYIAGYIFAQKLNDAPCKMSLNESIFSISVYASYAILFFNFFIRTYFKRSVKPLDEKAKLEGKSNGLPHENDASKELHPNENGKAKELLHLDENGNLRKKTD